MEIVNEPNAEFFARFDTGLVNCHLFRYLVSGSGKIIACPADAGFALVVKAYGLHTEAHAVAMLGILDLEHQAGP